MLIFRSVNEDHNDNIAADKELVTTERTCMQKIVKRVNDVNFVKRTMPNKTSCRVHADTQPGMLLPYRWEIYMAVATRSTRHHLLGKFLMSRRGQLSAESCGLPVSRSRRRTPGLRREDVSSIAGISTAYYTWIEQGRPFDISTTVLSSIADALKLSDVETRHVFFLAGKAEEADDTSEMPPWGSGIAEMVDSFRDGPAIALTSRLDVVAINALAQELFALEPGTNLAWWLFCQSEGRMRPYDWKDVGFAVAALLRRNAARARQCTQFDELIEQLCATSDGFKDLWDRQIVDSSPLVDVAFDHAERGRVAYRMIVLCDPVMSSQFVLLLRPLPLESDAPNRHDN
jgi:transcriptional regulator with XRE-family HTH domain